MAIVASSLSRCFLNKRYGEDAGSASETQCDTGRPGPNERCWISFSAGDFIRSRIFVNIAVEVYVGLHRVFAIGNCPGYSTGTF